MKKLIKLLAVSAPLALSLNANAADSVSLGDSGVSWLLDTSIAIERTNTFGNSTIDGSFYDNHINFTLAAPTLFNLSSTTASAFSFLLNGAFVNPPGLQANPFSGTLAAGNWQVDVKTLISTGNPNATVSFGSVAAVPEPETYAMLLAGLGLVGFSARRRQA